jgi:hypothetical protein
MYKIFTHTNSGVCEIRSRFCHARASGAEFACSLLVFCEFFRTHMASHGCPSIHHFFLTLATLYRVYMCVILSTPLIFLPYLGSCIVRVEQGFCHFFIFASELMSMNGRRAEGFYFQTLLDSQANANVIFLIYF